MRLLFIFSLIFSTTSLARIASASAEASSPCEEILLGPEDIADQAIINLNQHMQAAAMIGQPFAQPMWVIQRQFRDLTDIRAQLQLDPQNPVLAAQLESKIDELYASTAVASPGGRPPREAKRPVRSKLQPVSPREPQYKPDRRRARETLRFEEPWNR